MIQLNIAGIRQALETKDSCFYSIREIASDSDISERIISKVIRNKMIILDVRTLGKLVHYFQRKGLTVSVGDFFRWEGEELVPNIDFLIARLNPIPKNEDIVAETGIYALTVEDLARGNVKRIRLQILEPFLKYFRKRGLDIKLGDLLLEEEVVSRLDGNNHQRPETLIVDADQKRHDLLNMVPEYDSESVPVISTNIISLKHLLIAKKRKIYSNKQIYEGAGTRLGFVGSLMRGELTSLNLSMMGKLAHYFLREGLVIEVGDFFCWEGEGLVLNIGSLMARLDPIPTSSELHDETGISFLRVENLVRGNANQIRLHDLEVLLLFFRKRGLSIKLGNLLREKGTGLPRVDFFEDEERVRLAEECKVLEIEGPTLAFQPAPRITLNIFALKHTLIADKGRELFEAEVAQGAGVNKATLNRYLNSSVVKLRFSTISKLAYYFQSQGLVIEVGDFFRWEGNELVLNIGSLMTRLNPIATYEEVHDETGIPFSRVKYLVEGNAKAIRLRNLEALLLFFRKRGLSVDLGNLLREEGVDSLPRMFSLGVEEKVRLAEERQVVSTARKMLALGMDVTQIATVTGLNPEQIKVLA